MTDLTYVNKNEPLPVEHSCSSVSSSDVDITNINHSPKLARLIKQLKQQLKQRKVQKSIKANQLQYIKYPQRLVKSLEKLQDLIGMATIKDNIADQVIFLIMACQDQSPKRYMLNTVFYGPPGVGKTRVGVILAEIWYSLGYLENHTSTYTKIIEYNFNELTIFITLLVLAYIFQIFAFMYNKLGLVYLGLILGLLIILTLIVYYIYQYCNPQITETSDTSNRGGQVISTDSIIKIVSRKDFVAEYLGQTAIKTRKLLDNHRGQVLFIDEAYSLLNDSRDAYGLEALTTLNQFMSENPEEIVVIFAGYKDKMQHGIFAEQPGLPRRCIWQFECSGYTGAELFDIYAFQLQQDGWTIALADVPKIKALIIQQVERFPAYGGDTERLCFYSKLQATNDAFHNGTRVNHVIELAQVQSGLELLQTNNIQQTVETASELTSSELQDLYGLLHKYNKPVSTQ